MSRYVKVNDQEPNHFTIVWGKDEYTGAGWYLCVKDRTDEPIVVKDQKHDGLDHNELLNDLVFYGIDPIYAANTIQRES